MNKVLWFVIGMTIIAATVIAADQSVIVNKSQIIYWEVRNISNSNALITDAVCNLDVLKANDNTTFWGNYTNQVLPNGTYVSTINSSFPINSYLSFLNCTDGVSYATTSFTFDVIAEPIYISVAGLGGGGLTNEVVIFLVVIVLAVYLGAKYYLDNKK